MLGLRTTAGVPLAALPPGAAREVDALVRARLAARRGGRLALTSRGMDLHTSVAARLSGL
jgi:oxygen-independent coproporphyrinogen-3 oxidase